MLIIQIDKHGILTARQYWLLLQSIRETNLDYLGLAAVYESLQSMQCCVNLNVLQGTAPSVAPAGKI